MKSKFVLGSVFSAVMAVGVSTQTTPPQTGSQDSQSNRQVTFTGCLQSADAARASGAGGAAGSSSSATGTTGAGAASAGSAFVLMNAKTGSGSSTASSGTGSTGSTASGSSSPSSSSSGAMARIKLEGSQSDLQKYANSQVEVRGTLDSKMSGSTGSTTGSAATGSAATGSTATGSTAGATGSTSGQDMGTLRVTSVRQIASSCSGS